MQVLGVALLLLAVHLILFRTKWPPFSFYNKQKF